MSTNNTFCPCHSQKPYAECCKPYHEGVPPENALKLMRSRYSAYALGLAEYLMATTHPENPRHSPNREAWKKEILLFSKSTTFTDLQILEFIDGEVTAFVTFMAGLEQQGHDASFTEKSEFAKVEGRWLYKSGQIISRSS